MWNWLIKQWQDISGNVKFSILGILGVGVLSAVAALVHGLSWWQATVLVGLFALMLTWALISSFCAIKPRPSDTLITPDNVALHLRTWLDAFGFRTGLRNQNDRTHFGFDAVSPGIGLAIFRTWEHPHYLTLVSRVTVSEQDKIFHASLTAAQKIEFGHKLDLEAARARIAFVPRTPFDVDIQKLIPITSELSEADVIEGIQQIHFSAIIFHNAIATALDRLREATPPLLISDKEELPTLPT